MVSTPSILTVFKTDRVAPETAPHLMLGAASPLWLVFGGAAAAGATWWWWASRWREAVNLEALGLPVAVAETLPEAVAETVLEAVTEPLEIAAEATVETLDMALAVAETSAPAVVEIVDEVVETAPAALEVVAEVVAEAVPEAEVAPVELVAAIEPDAVVPEAVPEAPIEAAKAVVDDLTRLVGIGPKLAVSLSELGVTSFAQIAAWSADDLQSIDQLLSLKGRADRDAWIAQAKRFAEGGEA